jgi:hypothetical protein
MYRVSPIVAARQRACRRSLPLASSANNKTDHPRPAKEGKLARPLFRPSSMILAAAGAGALLGAGVNAAEGAAIGGWLGLMVGLAAAEVDSEAGVSDGCAGASEAKK